MPVAGSLLRANMLVLLFIHFFISLVCGSCVFLVPSFSVFIIIFSSICILRFDHQSIRFAEYVIHIFFILTILYPAFVSFVSPVCLFIPSSFVM